jgi:exodeoxyribonuclease VII large subunit
MGTGAFRKVYSVAEIAGILQSELESAFPDIWVEGEISQFKRAASGHLYITLREERATLRVVMWASQARRLAFDPETGARVQARGRLSFYPEGGDLQLYATWLEPSGIGAMMVALEQAKKRLAADGLTDPARKRPIPSFPRRVGVVTSAEGAALRDILAVLRRRKAGFDLVLAPSPVQGTGAAASLVAALQRLQRVAGVEVILISRGGGSLEDLWAFNDERLARAVAASEVPVISAVGHEVDTVLSDLTADLRAATPSVAAELLTSRRDAVANAAAQFERRLKGMVLSDLRFHEDRLRRNLAGRLGTLLERRRDLFAERVDLAERRLRVRIEDGIEERGRRLDRLQDGFSAPVLKAWFEGRKDRIQKANSSLHHAGEVRLESWKGAVAGLARLLHSLSPLAVIARGYSAAFAPSGTLVVDPSQVPAGAPFTLALRGGSVRARSEGEGSDGLPEAMRRVTSGE